MASDRPLRAVAVAKSGLPVPPDRPVAAIASAKSAPAPSRRVTERVVKATANTLDGSWDRRLSRGLASPDVTLDLHGHTLASAHALLDQGLNQALTRGDRLVLLVTGKPPRPESERPHARGAIRAAVADWLTASRFADRIAAVRNAHPRHGGAGALYIILRRQP